MLETVAAVPGMVSASTARPLLILSLIRHKAYLSIQEQVFNEDPAPESFADAVALIP
jgi:hypothetical protein